MAAAEGKAAYKAALRMSLILFREQKRAINAEIELGKCYGLPPVSGVSEILANEARRYRTYADQLGLALGVKPEREYRPVPLSAAQPEFAVMFLLRLGDQLEPNRVRRGIFKVMEKLPSSEADAIALKNSLMNEAKASQRWSNENSPRVRK